MSRVRKDICNLSFEEMKEVFCKLGEPPYRARQIFRWLYNKSLTDFKGMTDFSRNLTSKLEKMYFIGSLECQMKEKATDGTSKFLWGLKDGHSIETVLIRQGYRRTLCLSTQVGCKFGCPFCVSGSKGFVRNLTLSEILGQASGAVEADNEAVTNIVFMGIGEPLDNFDRVAEAVKIFNHPDGFRIGARKITLSTCGLVPGILKLSRMGIQIELSVSLHATTDALRNHLVPVNRKFPLEVLFAACEKYTRQTGRRVTLEYAVMEGVNDSTGDALRLAGMAARLNAKVNLISCNANHSPDFRGTAQEGLRRFQKSVMTGGVEVTVRRKKGEGIMAACGQLVFDRPGMKPQSKTGPQENNTRIRGVKAEGIRQE